MSSLNAVLPGDKTNEKRINLFNSEDKPVILKALKEAGGRLLVQINVAALQVETISGQQIILEGDPKGLGLGKGKLHEITPGLVESDAFSPEFGSAIAEYLRTKQYNVKNPEAPKKFATGIMTGSSVRVNAIDVYTQQEYVEKIRKTEVVSGFPSYVEPAPVAPAKASQPSA